MCLVQKVVYCCVALKNLKLFADCFWDLLKIKFAVSNYLRCYLYSSAWLYLTLLIEMMLIIMYLFLSGTATFVLTLRKSSASSTRTRTSTSKNTPGPTPSPRRPLTSRSDTNDFSDPKFSFIPSSQILISQFRSPRQLMRWAGIQWFCFVSSEKNKGCTLNFLLQPNCSGLLLSVHFGRATFDFLGKFVLVI